MPPDFCAIDPDSAVVVHRLKVQQDALAGPFGGNRHRAAVPNRVVIIVVFDAGQFGFRAEGHSDCVVEFAIEQASVDTTIALIDFELPFAVYTKPIVTDELRTRVLAAGDIGHIKLPTEYCQK